MPLETEEKSEEQLADYLQNNELQFVEHALFIRYENGTIGHLKLKPIQKIIWNILAEEQEKDKPTRTIILKSRRVGCSTIIQAYMFVKWLKSKIRGKSIHEFLLAHKADSTDYLYDMVKLFHNRLPQRLKPPLKYSNQKKLTQKDIGSSIYVGTAEGKGVGVAGGFNMLHLSEVSRYEEPEILINGIMPTMPKDKDTIIIMESTAWGAGNFFHRSWLSAVEGINGYIPLFFPWFDDPKYATKPPEDFKLTQEERRYKAEVEEYYAQEGPFHREHFSLTDEQMYWYRQKRLNDYNGDEDAMKENYGSYPEECFLSSGRPVFHIPTLKYLYQQTPDDYDIGTLDINDNYIEFTEDEGGTLKIYQHPKDMHTYIIGADFAEGNNSYSDFCSACCLDVDTGIQAAQLHGKYSPEEWVNELNLFGLYYNIALLAPERNAGGLMVVENLYHDMQYPNIYQHESWDSIDRIVTKKLGWETTSKTKSVMIDITKGMLRQRKLILKDKNTIQEMIEFMRDEHGHANAPSGKHDDRVISVCIATAIASRMGMGEVAKYTLQQRDIKRKQGSVLWKNHNRIKKEVFARAGYTFVPKKEGIYA